MGIKSGKIAKNVVLFILANFEFSETVRRFMTYHKACGSAAQSVQPEYSRTSTEFMWKKCDQGVDVQVVSQDITSSRTLGAQNREELGCEFLELVPPPYWRRLSPHICTVGSTDPSFFANYLYRLDLADLIYL